MSSVEYIRYTIDPARADKFEQAYRDATAALARSAVCERWEMLRCVEEPDRYVMRIEWTSMNDHLSEFRTSDEFKDFIGHVGEYIGDIDEMRHYEQTGVVGVADAALVPTLFEWAGGSDAIRSMIDAFYDRVERSELFADLFGDTVSEEHRARVSAWWSEVFGGPSDYTDDHGGYDTMLDHHRNLAITTEQRESFVTEMSRAADTAGLPVDPEFRSALLAYLEWGTRLALENSRPDSDPFTGATVPRWGWGVAPPYKP